MIKDLGIRILVAALLASFFFLAGQKTSPPRPPDLAVADLDAFHRLYYDQQKESWGNTYWLGVSLEKCPFDLHIYQEILYETKPDVLIECGTDKGGSAYYFASIFDLLGHGRLLTIDMKDFRQSPPHPRVVYFLGDSVSAEMVDKIKGSIRPGETVMVSLDSDHHMDHVLKELKIYSAFVTLGNYLVVEDTNINGHPVLPDFGPGPAEAVDAFLARNSDFQRDRTREKFGLTFFPGGYLKRIK